MSSVYLTTQLRIHDPSRRKRAIFDRAMRVYTLAYGKLLRLAEEMEEEIQSACRYGDGVPAMSIATYLARLFGPYKDLFPMHSSMRESLYQDAARNLASYFELKERSKQDASIGSPSWPKVPDLEKGEEVLLFEYNSLLDKVREVASGDEARQIELEIRRNRASCDPLPVFFCRPDGNVRPRNFGLCYEPETGSFWARLFLLARSDSRKRPLKGRIRHLVAMHKDAREVTFRPKPVPYLMVPLECGEWQERKFLGPALSDPSIIRTAALCKKGDGFYLHVTFEFAVPPPVEAVTVLALTAGRKSLLDISITDMRGAEVFAQSVPGDEWWEEQKRQREVMRRAQKHGENRRFYFRRINDNIVHMLANEIVKLAKTHSSQVVILANRKSAASGGPVLRRKATNYILNRRPYGKLEKMLKYKLPLAGLPRPATIYPWKGMLKQCAACGREAPKDGGMCVCGHQLDFDLERALKVARRWLGKSGENLLHQVLGAELQRPCLETGADPCPRAKPKTPCGVVA